MKIQPHPHRRQRGTAVVVVLALLILILAFMAGNQVTLRALKQELHLIEKRQLRKFSPPATGAPGKPGATAAPSLSPPPTAACMALTPWQT